MKIACSKRWSKRWSLHQSEKSLRQSEKSLHQSETSLHPSGDFNKTRIIETWSMLSTFEVRVTIKRIVCSDLLCTVFKSVNSWSQALIKVHHETNADEQFWIVWTCCNEPLINAPVHIELLLTACPLFSKWLFNTRFLQYSCPNPRWNLLNGISPKYTVLLFETSPLFSVDFPF